MIAVWFHEIASHVGSALRALNTREIFTTTADILIVYYLIYRVLKLVRGTRAAQTMAGMALIIALFFAAKKLNLITVSWIFEKLIEYFIIFFVVIFQQDIRRALMQIGQNLFLRQKYEETYVIEEVVQAAGDLAKQRIGALVVIERDADLSEHLGEVGVELDAKVTKELLVTLFIPETLNHMHDGAVIIRNLRVQQAGAVLPLSANSKLDKQLGPRHRAAIGITEETDAVVVVVSEERGTVSLCFNGNIARDLDAATLRKALLGLFQKKKNKGKGQTTGKGGKGARSSGDLPLAAGGPARSTQSVGDQAAILTPEPRQVPAELIPLLTTQPLTRPPSLLDDPMLNAETVEIPVDRARLTQELGDTTQPLGVSASEIVALAAMAAAADAARTPAGAAGVPGAGTDKPGAPAAAAKGDATVPALRIPELTPVPEAKATAKTDTRDSRDPTKGKAAGASRREAEPH